MLSLAGRFVTKSGTAAAGVNLKVCQVYRKMYLMVGHRINAYTIF